MTRVLIAERDEAIAVLLQTTICRVVELCDVTLAHDPESAVAELRSGEFDLVLLDVGLYSDGLETLRHLRNGNEHCAVIALTTGLIAAPLLKTLAAADVFAVVAKPFDLTQLDGLVVESIRPGRLHAHGLHGAEFAAPGRRYPLYDSDLPARED
jgi:CheY-like chemotaxis protein